MYASERDREIEDGGRGGAIEDINLRSFLIKGTPPGNGGNLLRSPLVLEIKKPITRPMWL